VKSGFQKETGNGTTATHVSQSQRQKQEQQQVSFAIPRTIIIIIPLATVAEDK
jgi:hypothetical protein